MAKRTEKHDDMSLLNNRILSLMEEKGNNYNSARKLALALYEGRYFKDMEYHFDKGESDLRQRDIWRIEKQINKHLNTIDVRKINGEYLSIYSQFFNCSTDYILGLTNIKSGNTDIRYFCEATGLSENAITNLLTIHNEELSEIPLNVYNEFFSVILDNKDIDVLRLDWTRLVRNKIKYLEESAEIEAWKKIKHRKPKIEMAIYNARMDSIAKTVDSNLDSYYGRIHKMMTEFSTIINNYIQKQFGDDYYQKLLEEKKEFLTETLLKDTKNR